MRTIFNKIAAAAIVVTAFLSSCQPDNLGLDIDSSNNGYTTIVFKANIPDMQQVVVRAVDPDGIDIQNIDLFCFNELGLYITTVSADIRLITPAHSRLQFPRIHILFIFLPTRIAASTILKISWDSPRSRC